MKNIKIVPKHQRDRLNDKQRRTVEAYTSVVKLKSVIRWRTRMAQAGISVKTLAEKVDKPVTRISEWLNFTHEPEESSFLQVEAEIYKLEKI